MKKRLSTWKWGIWKDFELGEDTWEGLEERKGVWGGVMEFYFNRIVF